ncbi:X-linked retinitis pigmentosa GTPase regulator isoform X2 [Paramormyrops kingsleyae]|uniref:X-linked retinitis pigmentosa GTPase regulator isoform X2 n=1 Tax=Paramormyrops kingsleyae TaxID=1676925 RepID=UPI003B973B6D
MAGETDDEIPESGAIFTFGKSKFADNIPSKFWMKNDKPVQISCGDEHTALITGTGKLYMFGSNNWGQLGLGTKSTILKPTCVKALKSERVKLAACGRNHTIVCTSRGNMYAAGGNSEGQLGLGDSEERTSFQLLHAFAGNAPIRMLAAGSNTSAALTEDGRLYMWGDNSEGQIGLGDKTNTLEPQEVTVGRPVSWVSCGYYHSALITVDGELFTFGESDSGKLGLPPELLDNHRTPQMVPGIPGRVVQVACGGGHTIVLTADDLYTFGLGQFGQLGHGTLVCESQLPREVEHFQKRKVSQVTCGENHTAVITDNGLLYTFGDGRHGKLGLGEENFTNQFKPTLCPRFLKYHVQSVACGGCHMLVRAKRRSEGVRELCLEEDDVTEDFLGTSYTELLGESSRPSLSRSLSARVRRRERERSPEQFGLKFHTLPPLKSGCLAASLPMASHTVPPPGFHRDTPDGRERSGQHRQAVPHETAAGNADRKDTEEQTQVEEIIDDNGSVKGLGDTTDFLNMTHVMKMAPGGGTLTFSPVQKDQPAGHSAAPESEEEDEEDEDEEEEEEEGEEEEEEENTKEEEEPECIQRTSEEIKALSCQGNGCLPGDAPQEPEVIKEESVTDGPLKEMRDNPGPQAEEKPKSLNKSENKTDIVKSKFFFGSNRMISLFKRPSTTESERPNGKGEATPKGEAEDPPSAGGSASDTSKVKDSNPGESVDGSSQPEARGQQRAREPNSRASRSATCTLV